MQTARWLVGLALCASLDACGGGGGPSPEDQLATCRDGLDNDQDGHLDCDDQDCEIFAICVLGDAGPSSDAGVGLDAGPGSEADTGPSDDAWVTTDPCAGYTQCVTGTFTVETNPDTVGGFANTGTFDGIVGATCTFALAFDVAEVTHFGETPTEDKVTAILSGPVHVSLSCNRRDPIVATIRANLEGQPLGLRFTKSPWHDWVWAEVWMSQVAMYGAGSIFYSLDLGGSRVPVSLDAEGYPVLGPFNVDSTASLTRHGPPSDRMTDQASGPCSYENH